jgi:hypothetical protein
LLTALADLLTASLRGELRENSPSAFWRRARNENAFNKRAARKIAKIRGENGVGALRGSGGEVAMSLRSGGMLLGGGYSHHSRFLSHWLSVHRLFTPAFDASLAASGLRLETRETRDKKIS